jgi:flagellar basal-body rod modification protein FlgD
MSLIQAKNQKDRLTPAVMTTNHKSGSNEGVIGAGFQNLYKSMDAERKKPSEIINNTGDMKQAVANIDEAMDFAIKLMISSAKNMGMPTEDGGDNKSQEMSQMAQGIASMMATKASVQAQMESIEQQKKPAIDLMSLKGKLVEYDDSKRYFLDKPVTYNYRITHNEPSSTASINLTMTIKNEKGIAVRTVKQSTKAGEYSFKWDGSDDKGRKLQAGNYSFDLKADGYKIVNDRSISFPVTASATLMGKVDAVKVEKGIATAVVINGKMIARENITDVRDMPESHAKVELSSNLIGRKVELDFSRAQVEADGSMEVYLKNHIEKPGDITVQVYNENSKFLSTLTSKEKIEQGVSKISFSNTNLDAGVYNIKVFVQDEASPENIKNIELDYKESIFVAGVSRRYGVVMSNEQKAYSPLHITSVLGNYRTPIEERRAELVGSQVMYRNDLFQFSKDDDPISFSFKLPKEDAVISIGRMNIYDEETSELVAKLNAEYDLYSLLDDDSRSKILPYLQANFSTGNYKLISGNERIEINRYMKNAIAQGELKIADKYIESYNGGLVEISFPVWDGKDISGNIVSSDRLLRKDFTPIYSRDSDGMIFSGDTDKSIMIAGVESVAEQDGELNLYLIGGKIISEDLVLSYKK